MEPRRLAIAYVTETWPPEINGVANTVHRAVAYLRGRGHRVQVVRPRQPAEADRAPSTDGGSHDGAAAELLTAGAPIPMYRELRMGFERPRRLARAWRVERPDVVHIATEGPLGFAALMAARRLRIPATSDFRTNFHLYSRHYRLGWVLPLALAYLRWFHNRAQATMVPTRALQGELGAQGFANLSVVGRGVDTALYSPAQRCADLRRSWDAGPDDLVVLHVGRLAPEKNIGLVLRAFDAMRLRDRSARLVLVGDGPLRAHIARTRPDVVLAGWRRGPDLARCYASGDVFVFPSLTETFGNVVLEALASGLPLVAYDHAAAGEHTTDGVSAALARAGDETQFLACAAALAADRTMRTALSAAARSVAVSQQWERVLERLEAIMASVTRGAARPADAGPVSTAA